MDGMSEEGEHVIAICQSLGNGVVYREGIIRYCLIGGSALIQIPNGFDFLTVFEDGRWHISGDARNKVMRAFMKVSMKARAKIKLDTETAAREYSEQVERNNEIVLRVMEDPKGALTILQE